MHLVGFTIEIATDNLKRKSAIGLSLKLRFRHITSAFITHLGNTISSTSVAKSAFFQTEFG